MIDKNDLGRRMKRIRESRHQTLKNIEAKAGISATHISEIERGKTSPTLGVLMRIAEALGKDPAYFVEADDLGDWSLVTAEERRTEAPRNVGRIEHLTTPIPGGRLHGCRIRLEPGCARHEKAHSHHGSEGALVLSGSVTFVVEGERYDLAEGDSITYGAWESHTFENASATEPVELAWVCTERGVT